VTIFCVDGVLLETNSEFKLLRTRRRAKNPRIPSKNDLRYLSFIKLRHDCLKITSLHFLISMKLMTSRCYL